MFDGKEKYEDPKLVWVHSTGLIALVFLDSDKLETQFRNDMFVGNVHNRPEFNRYSTRVVTA
jgi:glucose/arabinose dehydrogenase